jgi:hypothetical protein
MFGSTRHMHPQHRDQQIRRLTVSVMLHLIAAAILLLALFLLLSR